MTYIDCFLQAVLGLEAASALQKAVDQTPNLATVLGTRAIVGWLDLVSRWGYEGDVPGLPGSYLSLTKNEQGSFVGEIRVGRSQYDFTDVDLSHVAASMAVVLGVNEPPDIQDKDLVYLGKNIDLLLKAQVVREQSASSEDGDLEKVDEGVTPPGPAAVQNPPSGPAGGGFTPPKATQKSKPKKKTARLTMSEANTKCSVCNEIQVVGELFKGCACFQDLAKYAKVEVVDTDGYQIDFGPEWSEDDVSILLDIVRS